MVWGRFISTAFPVNGRKTSKRPLRPSPPPRQLPPRLLPHHIGAPFRSDFPKPTGIASKAGEQTISSCLFKRRKPPCRCSRKTSRPPIGAVRNRLSAPHTGGASMACAPTTSIRLSAHTKKLLASRPENDRPGLGPAPPQTWEGLRGNEA